MRTLDLQSGMTLSLSNALTIEATGALNLRGGSLACSQITLDGGVINAPSGFALDGSFDLAGEGTVVGIVSGTTNSS